MSQHVIEIPGLPDDVEVRRSTRRRRSVTAYREAGRTIVVVPSRMTRAEIVPYVEELVGRLDRREARGRRTDEELMVRAAELSRRYLDGRAEPASVRWVANQRRRWGSCTPLDRTIRLSDRLAPMPAHVSDYVLLHELAHLLEADHGPAFEAWMARYPRLLEARAFLAGVDHATGAGLDRDVDAGPEADRPEADRPEADRPESEGAQPEGRRAPEGHAQPALARPAPPRSRRTPDPTGAPTLW
jgi:hypothetical protein